MTAPCQVTGRLIGDARLSALLAECHNDSTQATELFVWNVRAAGAALEAVHVFELVLRNAIDRELRLWHQSLTGTTDWILHPHPFVLKVIPKLKIDQATAKARSVATARHRTLAHDDVLAQLSLGVWRYVLPSHANRAKQRLWREATSSAFPHWRGAWDPQSIVARVANAHELRNRVAHLEPLHHYDLRRARRDMRSVCHAVGPDAARLFVSTERLLPLIEANPLHSP